MSRNRGILSYYSRNFGFTPGGSRRKKKKAAAAVGEPSGAAAVAPVKGKQAEKDTPIKQQVLSTKPTKPSNVKSQKLAPKTPKNANMMGIKPKAKKSGKGMMSGFVKNNAA